MARLPDNIPAHQAMMLRQVELSVGRPQTLHGNVHQVDHVTNGPTNSAAITTVFPLRLCGGMLLVAVTRERRYGPSRLRVNDEVHKFESGFPSVSVSLSGHFVDQYALFVETLALSTVAFVC